MTRPTEAKAIKTRSLAGTNQVGNGSVVTAHVDRLGFDCARVAANLAVADPAPTSNTALIIVQHDDDPAFGSPTTFATVRAASADVKGGLVVDEALDLRGAKRYVRMSSTLTFTGGSSPAQKIALALTLAGAQDVPV